MESAGTYVKEVAVVSCVRKVDERERGSVYLIYSTETLDVVMNAFLLIPVDERSSL